MSFQAGSWPAALAFLASRGVRLASFIDVGSADGYHSIALWYAGLLRQSTVLNIDANPVYEPTLKKVQEAIGGHYKICGVGEHNGSIALRLSVHPYWASTVADSHPYWGSVNQQIGNAVSVPCRTLDSLAQECGLTPPHVLKLDIQGYECQALRGAREVLAKTAAIVCEVFLHSFHEVNRTIEESGFTLFDVTNINRTDDHRFGWCDLVYVNKELAHLVPQSIWVEERNRDVQQMQEERRARVLAEIDAILSKLRS